MKKKTAGAIKFIEKLFLDISTHPLLRQDTRRYSEADIQREMRPFIIESLQEYWKGEKFKDYKRKANASFYWEGQEGNFNLQRTPTFGSKNYPDFIILEPYLVAVEYKQSTTGALVKHGIGQSLVHTLSGDFDFVLFIFKDQNPDNRIYNSLNLETKEKEIQEKRILDIIWKEFNVMVKILPFKSKK